MTAIYLAAFVVFVCAQGGAVFTTAWLGLRALRWKSGAAKVVLMGVSYLAWVVLTIGGFVVLGGGGLMEGLVLVLALCLTALISAAGYLMAWMLWRPSKARVAL